MLRASLIALVCLTSFACAVGGAGDGDAGGDEDGDDASCTPGESAGCVGPAGCTGYQVCDDDGTFLPCDCGGGAVGAGPASGAAGPASSSGSGPPKDCGLNIGGPPGCDECFASSCCAYGKACAASQPCMQFGACASACGNDVNCQIECATQFSDGYDAYANIVLCMQQACPQCVQ